MDLLADSGDFDQLRRCGTDPAKDGRRRRQPTHRQTLFVRNTAVFLELRSQACGNSIAILPK